MSTPSSIYTPFIAVHPLAPFCLSYLILYLSDSLGLLINPNPQLFDLVRGLLYGSVHFIGVAAKAANGIISLKIDRSTRRSAQSWSDSVRRVPQFQIHIDPSIICCFILEINYFRANTTQTSWYSARKANHELASRRYPILITAISNGHACWRNKR